MAVVNGYASIAEIRAQVGDDGSKLSETLLEKAVNAASRAIERYCGRKFWLDAATSVRTYRVDDDLVAWVDDIGTSVGLVVKTDDTGDAAWATTWDSADYQLEPLNANVVAAGDTVTPYAWWRIAAIDDKTFPVHPIKVTLQVTAKFGWSSVPDEVNEACVLKAVSLFKRKDSPQGIAGFGEFGAVRVTRKDPDVIDLLAPYRRMHLGVV